MSTGRRRTFVFLEALLLFRCTVLVENTNDTAVLVTTLDPLVNRALVSRLDLILDEVGTPLFTTEQAATEFVADDGMRVVRTVRNVDSDTGYLEAVFSTLGNPYGSAAVWPFRLRGNASFPPFCVIAKAYGVSATEQVLASSTRVCTDRNGNAIQLAGAERIVDVLLCQGTTACVAGDAGSDGGTVDAGADGGTVDAGADGGTDADAGGDAGSDAGTVDAGADGGTDADAGGDAGIDSGVVINCDLAWGAPTIVGYGTYPTVAVDSQGNAVAVWENTDAGVSSILANRFDRTVGRWGDAGLIETELGSAYRPRVAMDPAGNAVAVWFQTDGGTNIYANRFSWETATWGTAVAIEPFSGAASTPQVAVASSGKALAVWQQSDGVYDSIFANQMLASGTWGATPLAIEAFSGSASPSPQIAMDPSGNVIAVWGQFDGIVTSIYWNRFNATSELWGDAGVVESLGNDCNKPYVSVDSFGNAIAVWEDDTRNIYSNRYNAGSGSWEGPVLVEQSGDVAESQKIAVDSAGNAFAVWAASSGPKWNVYWNRYDVTTGRWGDAGLLHPPLGYGADPSVVVDPGGNAVAVWSEWDGGYNVAVNRFKKTAGRWGDAGLIEVVVGTVRDPQIVVDLSGNAIAVWTKTGLIYGARAVCQ